VAESSGVTIVLSQRENLALIGPLVTAGGPLASTRKKLEK